MKIKNANEILQKPIKNKAGLAKKGIAWVDPMFLTKDEQAALYCLHWQKNKIRLMKQRNGVKAWQLKNKEKCARQNADYKKKHAARIKLYNNLYSKKKK